MPTAHRRRALLIFDGDCGFCTWSVNKARRWIRPDAQIVPWQRTDLAALGLTAAQCTSAVQWVAVDGEVSSGGRAVAAALRSAPFPWPVLGVLADLPVVDRLVDRAYVVVAANRHRLPGSTPACALPPPAAA